MRNDLQENAQFSDTLLFENGTEENFASKWFQDSTDERLRLAYSINLEGFIFDVSKQTLKPIDKGLKVTVRDKDIFLKPRQEH